MAGNITFVELDTNKIPCCRTARGVGGGFDRRRQKRSGHRGPRPHSGLSAGKDHGFCSGKRRVRLGGSSGTICFNHKSNSDWTLEGGVSSKTSADICFSIPGASDPGIGKRMWDLKSSISIKYAITPAIVCDGLGQMPSNQKIIRECVVNANPFDIN